MSAPRVSFGEKDLENGAPGTTSRAQSRKWSTAPGNIEDLDEYTALQKYISTYRDPKERAEEEAANKNAADAGKGKAWWQFWRAGSSPQATGADAGVVPDEWLETDIKQGLSNTDVESRRKRYGFNEITTDKENLFLKFLGFFQGPILYGMSSNLFFMTSARLSSAATGPDSSRRARIVFCGQLFPRSHIELHNDDNPTTVHASTPTIISRFALALRLAPEQNHRNFGRAPSNATPDRPATTDDIASIK